MNDILIGNSALRRRSLCGYDFEYVTKLYKLSKIMTLLISLHS